MRITGKLLLTLCFCLLFLFFFFPFPKSTKADTQEENICYSQCAVYKFFWRGDACWDMFQNECSVGGGNQVVEMINFLKTMKSTLTTPNLESIATPLKAILLCTGLIDDCIVPQLNSCRQNCSIAPYLYAPNLVAGCYGLPGITYNDQNETLTFRVSNDGLAYAWDIVVDASVSFANEPNGSFYGESGGTILNETIPELLFSGARFGSPPDLTDVVIDFLIDESNFSNFLSRFKSDADHHYVPPAWVKTIQYYAPEDKLTRIIFNVDSSQFTTESNEIDNTYVLYINKLPTPMRLSVEYLEVRDTGVLSEYKVSVKIANSGEEGGDIQMRWYEGNYEEGKSTIAYGHNYLSIGASKRFEQIIPIDVSQAAADCYQSQKFTLVVTGPDGARTIKTFFIPRVAGTVYGGIKDLFGKKVVGATITASTGQTTQSDGHGFYRLKGIKELGKITITASHPDFSQSVSEDINLSFTIKDNLLKSCPVKSLMVNPLDFVLANEPADLTITVKDQSNQPISATVLAASSLFKHGLFRREQEIEGEGVIEAMQPGEYRVTVSSPGYYTIFKTINLEAPSGNEEFVLERFTGRSSDGGLSLHAPVLLWEKTLDQGIPAAVSATKNGSLLIIYTAYQGKQDSGQLYFIQPLTGQVIAEIAAPATKGQPQVALDTSYDGRTTALYVHAGSFGQTKGKNILTLYSNYGNETGRAKFEPLAANLAEVSPDGFYLYPHRLMNSGLYVYSIFDIRGTRDREEPMTYQTSEAAHFLSNNTLVAGCKEGQCVQALNKETIQVLGKIDGSSRVIDSSFDGGQIIIRSGKKLYHYNGGNLAWEKELKDAHDSCWSASISPGGLYSITTSTNACHGGDLKLFVFDANGNDVTPEGDYKDVYAVFANDQGLFYLSARGSEIKYFQIGKYDKTKRAPINLVAVGAVAASGGLGVLLIKYRQAVAKFIGKQLKKINLNKR